MADQAAVTTGAVTSRAPGGLACAVLFSLPVLAGGRLPVVPVGGVNLFAFRIAVLAASFFPLLTDPRLTWLQDKAVRLYALVGVVWIFWGILAVFWAAGTEAAVVNLMGVALGFLTVLALLNLRANTTRGLRWLFRGWVAAAVVAGSIGVWEFVTGQHLPGSWIDNTPARVQRLVVISTFDNPNNFGAFLLLVSAVALYQMETARSAVVRWSLFFFVLWLFVLAMLSTSKIAVLSILMVIGVYVVRAVRSRMTAVALVLAIAGGFVSSLIYLGGDLDLLTDIVAFAEGGLTLEQSTRSRVNLFLAGVDMTVSTYGLGVGGGNFSYLMERGYSRLWTRDIVDPHNWWMEILSQYGVVVFALYVGYLAYVALFSLRASRGEEPLSRFLLPFVLAFVLSGFANSSYVLQPTNWLFMGTILMMVSCTRAEVRRLREGGDGASTSRDPGRAREP
jgi:teichuronic acid biosynthesis protein TuaE